MRIVRVAVNNRRKAFVVGLSDGRELDYPYARLELTPSDDNRPARVYPDPEIGFEGFTYELDDGREGTVLVDQILEYHEDPTYLAELLLYRLTLEAQKRVRASGLGKRELIRRLGTSPSQLYRLLDQTNYSKSIGQMVALLHILGCEVDLVVREKMPQRA